MNQRHPQPPDQRERQRLSTDDYDGVILDLDGVVTDTASLHFAAWKEVFDEVLRARELGVAIVSSSKNCRKVLETTGLVERFDAHVDGTHLAADPDLTGKPAPDMFLEAARRIGVEPDRAIVVEDAESGVEAGRSGGFGLVVGVAREDEARPGLTEHGADVVVSSMDAFELTGGEEPAAFA